MANDISIDCDDAGDALLPLTPRSIVLSLLLGSHPPRMRVGRILEFTSLFDLADGAVRTALSRMATTGDVSNDGGVYQLSQRLLERQAEQDAGRIGPPAEWDRTWWTAAVLSERRTVAERRRFRAAAIAARLGELRPGIWMRPANIGPPLDLDDVVLTRGPLVAGDEQRLVAQLWDIAALNELGAGHLRELADAASALARGDDRSLAVAFTALAAAQRFLRVEPQLPSELALSDSSADTSAALRASYDEVVGAFQQRLAEFFAARPAALVSTDER